MLLKPVIVAATVFLSPVLLLAQSPPVLAIGPAVESLPSPEKASVIETLERYLKGYSAMDPDMLSSAIHADASYMTFQLYKADDQWQIVNMASGAAS